MVEPTGIGALVAATLGMAADAALKGFVGDAAKDLYKSLRERIANWASADVNALVKEPASKGRQAIIAELIDGQPEPEKAELLALSHRLIDALKVSGSVGLDVDRLEALQVQLGSISVSSGGIGARFGNARVQGMFKTGNIDVRGPQGKG
jgi:hypothetical protein